MHSEFYIEIQLHVNLKIEIAIYLETCSSYLKTEKSMWKFRWSSRKYQQQKNCPPPPPPHVNTLLAKIRIQQSKIVFIHSNSTVNVTMHYMSQKSELTQEENSVLPVLSRWDFFCITEHTWHSLIGHTAKVNSCYKENWTLK